MADNAMLQEAIEAARVGQRARARDLLTRLLRADQNNSTYWLYMSAVVDAPKERVYCLERALQVDPSSELAKRGLVLLGARPADERLVPVRPASQRVWDIAKIAGLDEEKEKGLPLPILRMAGLSFIGLAALGLIFVGIFGNPFNQGGLGFRPTLGPLVTSGPSPTFLPSNTPFRRTPTPTFLGPTPLSFFLVAPYTPTPRYVVTPHDDIDAYRSGIRNLDTDDWEEAITFFEQAIEQNPESADLRYHMGDAYLELGIYLRAKDYFNQAINLNPEFGAAYLGRAKAQIGLQQTGVLEDLDTAIAKDPGLAEAYLLRARYRLDRRNAEGALEDVEVAEALIPLSGVLHSIKADALLQLGRAEEALEAAQLSNQLDITIVDNYRVLGEAFFANDMKIEAIGPLQTYLTYEIEDADTWLLLGQAQQAGGFHDVAVRTLDHALELKETLGEVFYYRGYSYLELGEYDLALADLQRAVALYDDWFEPGLALGRTEIALGRTAEGYFTINALSSLAKTDEQKASFYYYRALALEALGDQENANRDWTLLLALPAGVVPEEWLAQARERVGPGANIPTPGTSAPTRVPTRTSTPTRTPTP